MRPSKNPTLKDLRERTTQMLQRIDDTPIAQIDATYYQHYFEELRLLAEKWQARTVKPPPIKPTKVWRATRNDAWVGIFTEEAVTALVRALPDVTVMPHTLRTEVTAGQLEVWSRL